MYYIAKKKDSQMPTHPWYIEKVSDFAVGGHDDEETIGKWCNGNTYVVTINL